MENTKTLPQRVVDQKTIILKSRLDPTKVRLLGEDKKTNFFIRFGFIKPKSKDITLVGFSKYYEPFIVIGGKYWIDYCKKHLFELKADNEVQKIFVGGEEVKLEPFDSAKPSRALRLVGEEHYHYVDETYFVLDRLKRELPLEKIHIAPFEHELENAESFNLDLRKVSISLEEEIEFLRSKIVKRPSNADFIIKEIFEINERMIIYNPMYELVFQNFKTSRVVTVIIDGVTGKLAVAKLETIIPEKLNSPEKMVQQDISLVFQEAFKKPIVKESINQNEQLTDASQNVVVKKETDAPHFFEVDSSFEAEKAITLATDSMKRLGFKSKITPLKVFPDGELYVVELNLQNKTAKVLVNTKLKEVKEYDIQEINAN